MLTAMLLCLLTQLGHAHIGPRQGASAANQDNNSTQINFRSDCANAVEVREQAINNVRARLTTGGDVWWNGADGRYVVPKVPSGVDEVSSLFAGAVWLGGVDNGGNTRIAAQQYGRPDGNFDFYPGPLTPTGTTSADTCASWDRFFVVTGEEIELFLSIYQDALDEDRLPLDPEVIPEGVLGWPAAGNPFFTDVYDFDLPDTGQGLAGFWNNDDDFTSYDPTMGDFPIIEIRGCSEEPQFPDEMTFWIYNDAGNIHRESGLEFQLNMEVQVQAFAFVTSDDINSMTFQRYKLINRNRTSNLNNTFFAMWVDPDLGCFSDDYVGCDTTRSLAYVYNVDEFDGTAEGSCQCDLGVFTYCERIPLLGVDYFRGPRDENGEEIGMSSFIYLNRTTPGNPPPGTLDPNTGEQYYRVLQGIWPDGFPLQEGGDGYDEGSAPESRYAFPDPPDLEGGWSMSQEALGVGDRRTVQASGPFTLVPGAVNELIIGVVWVPDQTHPSPSIRRLQAADDLAQDLFDNCFDLLDGPDAPDVDWIELDKELVAILSNPPEPISNNFQEGYEEVGFGVPPGEDGTYRFEGYRVYQLFDPTVDFNTERDDPGRVRLVAEVDVANGITRAFNWIGDETAPLPENINDPVLTPVLQVDGDDEGIQTTFRITSDAFSTSGDPLLINHRRYYFTVIAYAYNNYKDFDPSDTDNPGQPRQYLASNRRIGEQAIDREGALFYTVIPRPTLDRNIMANYGDQPPITRLAGAGNNGNDLRLSSETIQDVEAAFSNGEGQVSNLTYAPGAGPIDIKVYDPRNIANGSFELTMVDTFLTDDELEEEATWMLDCLDNCGVATILSEKPINYTFEQIIPEFGFSVTVRDVLEPGEVPIDENGAIGTELTYADPDGERWLSFIEDGNLAFGSNALGLSIFNYVNTGRVERFGSLDEDQAYSDARQGLFSGVHPYKLMDWSQRSADVGIPQPFISPVWLVGTNTNSRANDLMELSDLNNVDVVFTSNKELWSRCPVIETASPYYEGAGGFLSPINPLFVPEGFDPQQEDGQNWIMFDRRFAPSVTRDASSDDPNVPAIDPDAEDDGYGWFPGYAVDVETGQRLQMVFGENSIYDGRTTDQGLNLPSYGADMVWNPSSDLFLAGGDQPTMANISAGGQHFFYVTSLPYDMGEEIGERLEHSSSPVPLRKADRRFGIPKITWAGFPLLTPGSQLLSYADGLIPNDARLRLRVNNGFAVSEDNEVNNGYPTYQFALEDVMATDLDQAGVESALDMINVVPNPYYAFSEYEDGQFDTEVKITNLPAKCVVTIYNLEGNFIRQYDRDEEEMLLPGEATRGLPTRQISPALNWDLDNFRGIPVSSGVYLIHVSAPGLGERTLKWFGVNRTFDPTGL
ncbi:MAG: hypothetical protein AAGF87_11930 [Bacteroidota bacterium]